MKRHNNPEIQLSCSLRKGYTSDLWYQIRNRATWKINLGSGVLFFHRGELYKVLVCRCHALCILLAVAVKKTERLDKHIIAVSVSLKREFQQVCSEKQMMWSAFLMKGLVMPAWTAVLLHQGVEPILCHKNASSGFDFVIANCKGKHFRCLLWVAVSSTSYFVSEFTSTANLVNLTWVCAYLCRAFKQGFFLDSTFFFSLLKKWGLFK